MSNRSAFYIALQSGVPTLALGPAGSGKTSAIQAIARRLNMHCEVLIGNQRDPADIGGYPYPLKNRDGKPYMALLAPGFAHRILAKHKEGIRSLNFLDELTTCPPATQAALLRVLAEGVVGDTALPANTLRIAAGNPPEMAANGFDLEPPVANRLCHLEWEVNPTEWCDAILTGFPDPVFPILPEGWESLIGSTRNLVSAFIRKMPSLLECQPTSRSEGAKAWPSCRTWTHAATLMAAARSVKSDAHVEQTLVTGCVGEAASVPFFRWMADMDLPDPEALLADPKTFAMPSRGDRQWAILGSVQAAYIANKTAERWDAALNIMETASESVVDVPFMLTAPLFQTANLPDGRIASDAPKSLFVRFNQLITDIRG